MSEKAAREEQQLAAYKNQQREIASLQDFADRFRAKASKASQAQSKLKQIERMEKIEAPLGAKRRCKIPLPAAAAQRLARHHAEGRGSCLRRAGRSIAGLNFEAERGQRTVLVGPNGAGKSTLLKLLAGVLPVQRGDARGSATT